VEPIRELSLKDFACVGFAFAARIDPEDGEMTAVDVTCFAECSEDLISLVFEMSMLTRG